jgi:hypothetical protein
MNDEPRTPNEDPNEDETPAEVERALRALAELEVDDRLPAPADERLLAYREGRLGEEETREMERVLAHSASGRRRLLELAGVDRSLPLRRVRKAVLAATQPRRPARRITPWLGAAALAASVVLAVLLFSPRHPSLPAGLAYEVGAQGLAETRSGGEVQAETRVYADTPLRILVQPRGESPSGVSFALYRLENGALRRVRQPAEVREENDRGSVTFAGTASIVLATRAPGVYPLFVVAYTQEPPSGRIGLEPGQDPVAVLRDSGRLVYPVKVTLLRDDPPAERGTR